MKYYWIIAIAGLMMISSCSDLTSDKRYKGDNYYVSGLLVSGEYITGENAVKIGKTQDIEHAEWDMLPNSLAICYLYEIDPAGSLVNSITLMWQAEARGYIDYYQEMQIKAEYTYSLEIHTNEGNVIYAETKVPKSINILGDNPANGLQAWGSSSETMNDLNLELADKDHTIIIETCDDEEFNLYSEFWCMEDHSEAEYTYPDGDNDFPEDDEEYMGDTRQFPRRNIGFYMYQPEGGILEFNSYQGSIMFYGRTRLKLYSIDSNYLNYLYKSDGYEFGGINGGIGFWGSCCGRDLYTRVIKS